MQDFFIDPDISRAQTIPTDFYTDTGYFELSKEKLFACSWQFVGDTDRVSEAGSVDPFLLLENYLDEPLMLTRDENGILHCLSNVCTHRGNILVQKPCVLNQLTCRYHGRRFTLEGELMWMPEFKGVQDFPAPTDNLHALSLFKWGKLLFTSLRTGLPAGSVFEDIQKRMSWYPMERLSLDPARSKDYHVKANWALYCENYLEGFHIPFVHPGLNASLDFGKYTTELYRYSNLQVGFAKAGEPCFELPASSPDAGQQIAAYYFWAFPNTMLNFYPWGVSVNVVQPTGISDTKVSFYTYVLDQEKPDSAAGAGLDEVEKEDEEIVESVQKGVRSRFFRRGRYSVTREQGTHHFHSLITEFLKK